MAANRPRSRAWWIWGTAVVGYLAAVFHRGSLGVAGPLAYERFDVGPAALSAFTVLQVGIYAAMQIPTGLLVDRFGPRGIITVAVLLLGMGQLLFAMATTYPMGLGARAILGLGDAMTWVSILRLVAVYFSARQYALVATLSAALGAVGGVAATFPLAAVLHALGWTATFLLVGALTASYALITGSFLRNRPNDEPGTDKPTDTIPEMLGNVRTCWSIPGTRLAFWVHFGTMFVPNTLALLWGYPYLVEGLGIAPTTASVVLSSLIIGQIIGGPVVGALIGRVPSWRMPIVVGYLLTNALCWLVLLGWPASPPLGIVLGTFFAFALGGPVSTVAFALVRDYNPLRHVGTATGVANAGGHTAIASGVLVVGILLDVAQRGAPEHAYRIAMLGLVAMLVISGMRTFVWWRRARAELFAAQARGEPVPVVVRRHRWDLPESSPVTAT